MSNYLISNCHIFFEHKTMLFHECYDVVKLLLSKILFKVFEKKTKYGQTLYEYHTVAVGKRLKENLGLFVETIIQHRCYFEHLLRLGEGISVPTLSLFLSYIHVVPDILFNIPGGLVLSFKEDFLY